MKKLLTLCAAVLMAFAVTGSAMAADAVTVYIEPASATYCIVPAHRRFMRGWYSWMRQARSPPRLAAPRSVTQCWS